MCAQMPQMPARNQAVGACMFVAWLRMRSCCQNAIEKHRATAIATPLLTMKTGRFWKFCGAKTAYLTIEYTTDATYSHKIFDKG